ncbi:MAG: HAD family hydrolase [Bacteroidales bacterium]|nr:HAD family hydrolase [Bacteroidales bacterium]
MASIRSLKKDINFLTSELVTQAYLNQFLFKKISDEELAKYIGDALDFRNKFVERTNHPDGKDNPQLVRTYYKNLRKEMLEQFGSQYETLAQQLNEQSNQ